MKAVSLLLGLFLLTGCKQVDSYFAAASGQPATTGYVVVQPPPAPEVTTPEPYVYPDNTQFQIWVHGVRWYVVLGQNDNILRLLNLGALTECKSQVIFVKNGMTAFQQRVSMLHEVLHAGACGANGEINNKYYNSDTQEGHEGIYKISDFMISFIHDNTEFAKYLLQ
jgi:hypothetical protein